MGTFLGTYTRRQTQPDGVRRKRSRRFSQEKWSDEARRNQTQNALENLKTAVREHIGVDGCSASALTRPLTSGRSLRELARFRVESPALRRRGWTRTDCGFAQIELNPCIAAR